jgi:hypothetical protein
MDSPPPPRAPATAAAPPASRPSHDEPFAILAPLHQQLHLCSFHATLPTLLSHPKKHTVEAIRFADMKRARTTLQERERHGKAASEASSCEDSSLLVESPAQRGQILRALAQEEDSQSDSEEMEEAAGQDKEDNHADDGIDSEKGMNHHRHLSIDTKHCTHPFPAILLSPVSFQHTQLLRSKAFPAPPITRPPPAQSENAGAAAVADVQADARVGASDGDGNNQSASSAAARSCPPLVLALTASQHPARLSICIRQLKAELDSLRKNIDVYISYVRRLEMSTERTIMPSLMPFFTYLTASPPPTSTLTRRPTPEMVGYLFLSCSTLAQTIF